jgi:hypothetical protein
MAHATATAKSWPFLPRFLSPLTAPICSVGRNGLRAWGAGLIGTLVWIDLFRSGLIVGRWIVSRFVSGSILLCNLTPPDYIGCCTYPGANRIMVIAGYKRDLVSS